MARKYVEEKPLFTISRSKLIKILRKAGYSVPDNVSFVSTGGISYGENTGLITEEEPLEIWGKII